MPRTQTILRRTLLLGLALLPVTTISLRFSQTALAAKDDPPPLTKRDSGALIAIDKSHYDLRFGLNPYAPSEAKAAFSGFLRPEQIPSAAYCAHCHTQVHAEWRQSAHANAFRTPWYTKNIQLLAETKGIAFTRHCEGCHNPSALFTGALTPDSKVNRPNDNDGVTCMVCHSIKQVQNTRGLGSYVMGRPAVLLDATGVGVDGEPSDTEILTHLDRHSQAVMQPFYRSAEFCSTCHKSALPKSLNGYKWLRAFSTYDDWQQSSWSTETPLPFYTKAAPSTCQTCHMNAVISSDPSAKGGLAPSHRWLGANTAIPAQYGFSEQSRAIVNYLQNDQLNVDIFAITLEHREQGGRKSQLIAPLGAADFSLSSGDLVTVDVVVRNKGIGHGLVPELRDFYESWLDFSAIDDRGQTIYRSGAIDPNTHAVDPSAHSYTTRIISDDGKRLDHHEVWKVYARAYDASIASGRSDLQRYRFRIPDGINSLSVRADVNYRRFNRTFTDWVYTDLPKVADRFPTVILASGGYKFSVNSGHIAKKSLIEPLTEDARDLLRWNNYGIGLIDRQQFADAANAFKQALLLDPTYEPGYVNIAIAEYSNGRYDEALRWLARANKLRPDDARGQYYEGLCLRWQSHFDEAIAKLKPVGIRYPRFRQVHQELGYLYLVRKRYFEAKAEYLAVQHIDPDDALAHRWLGPIYEALGEHAAALAEATQTNQTRDDTAAGWTIQRFWRQNPNIATEAIPDHIHSDDSRDNSSKLQRMLNLQNPPSYIWIEH